MTSYDENNVHNPRVILFDKISVLGQTLVQEKKNFQKVFTITTLLQRKHLEGS